MYYTVKLLLLSMFGFNVVGFSLFCRYEGTVWDDYAHGKGVYVSDDALVRFVFAPFCGFCSRLVVIVPVIN